MAKKPQDRFVTIVEETTYIYCVKGTGDDDQAEAIARERLRQRAPMDLVAEETKISDVTVSAKAPAPKAPAAKGEEKKEEKKHK